MDSATFLLLNRTVLIHGTALIIFRLSLKPSKVQVLFLMPWTFQNKKAFHLFSCIRTWNVNNVIYPNFNINFNIPGVINYRSSNVVDFCNFYNTSTSFKNLSSIFSLLPTPHTTHFLFDVIRHRILTSC